MVRFSRVLPATVSAAITVLLLLPGGGDGQSLQGSAASLDRQNHQARLHDFTYLQTPDQVRRFVAAGYLVHLPGNADYRTHNVSFPYVRPEVRTFVERLSRQYRNACGEQLVVTSATRPQSHQPPNASSRSVHPTGMAIDLRVPQNPRCRSWLESTLMSLEGRGVIEAIRERRPPHYHLAVFPQPYMRYVAQMTGDTRLAESASPAAQAPTSVASTQASTQAPTQAAPSPRAPAPAVATAPSPAPMAGPSDGTGGASAAAAPPPWEVIRYRVRAGESLWTIARAHGTTVARLQAENGLRDGRIHPGQLLEIPVAGGSSSAGAAVAVQYRVRPGDSLWTIARAHGLSVDRIRSENELRTTRIYAGQVLTLPAAP